MKQLLPTFAIVLGTMFTSTAFSQVYVQARVNLPIPPIPLPLIPHVNVCAPSVPYYGGYDYDAYGRKIVVMKTPVYENRRNIYRKDSRFDNRGHYNKFSDNRRDGHKDNHRGNDRNRRH